MYSWYQALIVLALLKICLAAESDPTCVHFYNAKESEGCNTDAFNLPTDINNQPAGLAVCQITELNLRCNNGICVRGPYKPGDKCIFDSQCTTSLIGAELFCNATCKFAKYAEAGETCTHNKQCLNGVCNEGKCKSVQKDGDCSNNFDCGYGLFCDASKCAEISEGSTCNVDMGSNPCGPSMRCIESKCKKIYAKKVTETCLDQWDCEMGLECKGDKCSAVEYTANTACADCSSKGGQCLCDPHQGDNICVPNNAFAPEVYFNQKTRDSCNSGYQTLTQCMTENKCRELSMLPESCAMKNCGYLVRCYNGCLGTYYYHPAKFASAYSVDCVMPVDNTYNYAWTGVTGGILLIGAGFAGFYFWRKRRMMTPVRIPTDEEGFMSGNNDL
jgi:hypothetical protein